MIIFFVMVVWYCPNCQSLFCLAKWAPGHRPIHKHFHRQLKSKMIVCCIHSMSIMSSQNVAHIWRAWLLWHILIFYDLFVTVWFKKGISMQYVPCLKLVHSIYPSHNKNTNCGPIIDSSIFYYPPAISGTFYACGMSIHISSNLFCQNSTLH